MSTDEIVPSPGSASGVEEQANVQKLHMNAFGVIGLVAGAAGAVANQFRSYGRHSWV